MSRISRSTSLSTHFSVSLRTARRGVVLSEGVTVALVGSPNVGKSSLLNAFAGEEVAIVTDIAGTTRDRIEHWTAFDGVPVRIVDTAGLRETDDVVERKGIERTLRAVADADIVLVLTDASGDVGDDEDALAQVRAVARPDVPLIRVANKADKADEAARAAFARRGFVVLSARTGEGLGELRSRVLDAVDMTGGAEELFLARERHLKCLEEAGIHLRRALGIAHDGFGMMELLAEELRLSGRALGEILGETDAEGLLDIIFSRFCIGK